jgi:hypothetical protein
MEPTTMSSALSIRNGWFLGLVVVGMFAAAGWADGDADRPGPSSPPAPAARDSARPGGSSVPNGKFRVREGIELSDRLGTFELSGDRARFIAADDATSLTGLENLNLERVIHAIRDNPLPGQNWKVSGVVTEFEGRNYLLITRALLVAKPGENDKGARPAPRTAGRP